MDGRVDAAVEKHGASCFTSCPQPTNKTSLCYSECYAVTLEGDPMRKITPMEAEQVTKPWKVAFLPEAEGGCPEVPLYEA